MERFSDFVARHALATSSLLVLPTLSLFACISYRRLSGRHSAPLRDGRLSDEGAASEGSEGANEGKGAHEDEGSEGANEGAAGEGSECANEGSEGANEGAAGEGNEGAHEGARDGAADAAADEVAHEGKGANEDEGAHDGGADE